MLRIMRRGQRWIMYVVILLVGGAFVFYLGIGGPPLPGGTGDSLVVVGDRRYGPRDFQRMRENQVQQYRQALGDGFDAGALADQLDALAAGALVQLGVLAHEAERLGLRVSDAEVRRSVRAIPGAVDEDGQLRRDALRNFAEVEYGTERNFVRQTRDRLLAGKLLALLDSGVAVSEAEARDAVRHRMEEIRMAYVALDPAEPPPDFEASDEQIDRFLAEQEDRVRAAYEEQSGRFRSPEQVRARHILLRVETDAPPEQVEAVRERAAGVLERLRGGAEFAEVAREISDDPGSKAKGGDLGFFERGRMTPAFEEAAFALEPGSLSELIRTPFGFHILRVEERRPAQDRSFEDARRELAAELLAQEAGREAAEATARRLADAIRAGETLVDAARAEDVAIERTDWITRSREGFVPRLGVASDVLALAFSLGEESPSSERILRVGEKRVLVQLLERREPNAEKIEAELATEQRRLRDERRNRARELWLGAAQDRLEEAGEVLVNLTALRG